MLMTIKCSKSKCKKTCFVQNPTKSHDDSNIFFLVKMKIMMQKSVKIIEKRQLKKKPNAFNTI